MQITEADSAHKRKNKTPKVADDKGYSKQILLLGYCEKIEVGQTGKKRMAHPVVTVRHG